MKEHIPDIIVKLNKCSLTPEQFNDLCYFLRNMHYSGLDAILAVDEAPLIIKGRLKKLNFIARRQFAHGFAEDMMRCTGEIYET